MAWSNAAAGQEIRPWRTVIIPAAIGVWNTTVQPHKNVGRPLATASLPSVSAPVRPLVGLAHQTTGLASYYWQDQMTASGERFDKRALTAAHKTLPLGTRVRVTHATSGRSVVVRINDRGPFKAGRVIDLSEAAAEVLDMTRAGLAHVTLQVVR